jgi:hypothetical protein
LTRRRLRNLGEITKGIRQPKHVVLTARNSATLTRDRVSAFKAALARLRRSKLAAKWRGGLYSLEVTNEGRGWHLHAHLLVDADWIDKRALAVKWGELVGQDFAIVCVKDARGQDYLRELVKYAAKGSDLASWNGDDVAAFVSAFQGVRSFGVFGTLYKQRAEWRAAIAELESVPERCPCGATFFRVLHPDEAEFWMATRACHNARPPVEPAPAAPQLGLTL